MQTTLLRHILSNKSNLRIAAAVNDFAELNIDEDLIQSTGASERVVELSNGCVCCKSVTGLLSNPPP
jgi:G3E family GTPase